MRWCTAWVRRKAEEGGQGVTPPLPPPSTRRDTHALACTPIPFGGFIGLHVGERESVIVLLAAGSWLLLRPGRSWAFTVYGPHPARARARPRPGASHQFQEYYREGVFSKCDREFSELKFCFKLKASTEEDARRMLGDLVAADVSPTAGVVWEMRPPGQPGLYQLYCSLSRGIVGSCSMGGGRVGVWGGGGRVRVT
jgi:hypothetical protein